MIIWEYYLIYVHTPEKELDLFIGDFKYVWNIANKNQNIAWQHQLKWNNYFVWRNLETCLDNCTILANVWYYISLLKGKKTQLKKRCITVINFDYNGLFLFKNEQNVSFLLVISFYRK